MRSRSASLLIIAVFSITLVTYAPQAFASCGYLQTNRNPPYYYHGDTVYIYGGGFPANKNLRLLVASVASGGYMFYPILFPASVPSSGNGRVAFSFGPINPTSYYTLPVGWYYVYVYCSLTSHASTKFYFGG